MLKKPRARTGGKPPVPSSFVVGPHWRYQSHISGQRRVASPIPVPTLPSPTHGQATWQAGCSKHPTASKIPSGRGLPQSQRVLPPHRGPAATSALPHLCPAPPLSQCGSHCRSPPPVCPLQLSSCREAAKRGRLERGTIVYIFVQGKSGIIYGNSDVTK